MKEIQPRKGQENYETTYLSKSIGTSFVRASSGKKLSPRGKLVEYHYKYIG